MANVFSFVLRYCRRLLLQNDGDASQRKKGNEYASRDLVEIERETAHTVSIATNTSPEYLQKCHSQDQSPLFALPAEIRTQIFSDALTPDPWEDSFDAQLFRPTDRFSPQILQTCRRIWLEANSLIFLHAAPELNLYGSNSFGEFREQEYEATIRGLVDLDKFLHKLTPNNRQHLQLTIKAGMELLVRHNSLRNFTLARDKWPAHVTIILQFRQVSSWPLFRTLGQDPEGLRDVVCDLLRNAAPVGIRRFGVKIQALAEQRKELHRAYDHLSTAASSRELASVWSLDGERWESPRANARPEWGQIDVAVLEWCRKDDGHNSQASGSRHTTLSNEAGGHNGIEERSSVRRQVDDSRAEAKAAYLGRWKNQGSLLHFVDWKSA